MDHKDSNRVSFAGISDKRWEEIFGKDKDKKTKEENNVPA